MSTLDERLHKLARAVQALKWAGKAHAAVGCSDNDCVDGAIPRGDPQAPDWYECEWCAMAEEVETTLKILRELAPEQSLRHVPRAKLFVPVSAKADSWELEIHELIARDLVSRHITGVAEYGVSVRDCEIDTLQYAYEEALDLSMYLRKAIYDRDRVMASGQIGA